MGGCRDRALLLLGFAGALRRSELVGLDVADLTRVPTGSPSASGAQRRTKKAPDVPLASLSGLIRLLVQSVPGGVA